MNRTRSGKNKCPYGSFVMLPFLLSS